MSAALSDAVPETQIFEVFEDRDQKYLSVIYLREKQNEVLEALRPWGYNSTQLKSRPGTAAGSASSAMWITSTSW
jgi:hypothetical protein